MDIFKIFGFSICALVLVLVLKKQNAESAVILSLCAGAIVLLFSINSFIPLMDQLLELINPVGINNVYIVTLLKALGISLICQFVCESCRDAGENALAANVLFCGRVAVAFIGLPLFSEVMEIIKKILSL
ncbi:MAG: SpoIIIAC/SpoIIIAD family protein [Oscillospiraceae bacterium]